MSTLGDIELGKAIQSLLSSILPGRRNWNKYFKEDENSGCLENCPYYSKCEEGGPDDTCTTKWQSAKTTEISIRVVLHVLQNFDHYDRGDAKPISREEINAAVSTLNHVLYNDDGSKVSEGQRRLVLHFIRERNSKAAIELKEKAMRDGKLICRACRVDFFKAFKEKATRIVECHHTIPISSVEHKNITNKKDLVLLCANCHRIAHSVDKPLDVLDIRKKLKLLARPTTVN